MIRLLILIICILLSGCATTTTNCDDIVLEKRVTYGAYYNKAYYKSVDDGEFFGAQWIEKDNSQ